jgi:PAS domain S-box-containing protein
MLNFSKIYNYQSESEDATLFKETLLINFISAATCFFFAYSINNILIKSIYGFYFMFTAGIVLSIIITLLVKHKISFVSAVNFGNATAFSCLAADIYFTGGVHSPSLPWIILIPMASFLMLEKCASTKFWIFSVVILILSFGFIALTGTILLNRIPEDRFPIYLTTSYSGLAVMLAIMTNLFEIKNKKILEELQVKQNELLTSEKRFRTMFETSPLGISVANSITGEVTEMNAKYSEIVGRTPEEIKKIGWENFTYAEDLKEDLDNMKRMVNGEIPSYKLTKRYVKPDDSIVWVEMIISSLDSLDSIDAHHLCMIEDVTEKKELEKIETIKEQNSLLLRHSSQVPGVIYQVQLDTNDKISFPFVSEGVKLLFELNANDVMSDAEIVINCVHPDDIDAVIESMNSSMKSLQNWSHDFRIIDSSNKIKWLRGNSKPELLQDGTIISHGYVIDITSQKKSAELELQKNIELLNLQKALLELSKISADLPIEAKIQTILKKASETLKCERLIFWKFEEDSISSEYIYKLSSDQFLEGLSLSQVGHESYFKELLKNQSIISNDVFIHQSIKDLENYFILNGISSMMNLPVQIGNVIIGVISFENTGRKRDWSITDQSFARSISDMITLNYEGEELKNAKNEIRIKEQRWKFAIEASTDGMWDWDVKQNIVHRSPRWFEILGYGPLDLTNDLESYTSRIHPDDLQLVTSELQKHFSGETDFYSTEHRVLCKDGSYKWILDRGKVIIWDDNGEPIRVVGTKTDIEDRKKADLELQQSNEKLQAIYSGSNDAIMLLNGNGFIDGNPKSLEMFGMKDKNELTTCHPSDISPEFQPNGENSFELANKMVQIAFDKGGIRFEWVHKRKNGQTFPAEVLLSAFNYGGERILQSTVLDITERKLAAFQLENQKEFYESILNNIPTEIAVFDTENKYLFANPSAIRDTEIRNFMIGKNDSEFDKYRHEGDNTGSILSENLSLIKEKGQVQEWESSFISSTGKKKTIMRGMVPIYNQSGVLKQVIGYGFDITQRKVTERELEKSEKRLQLVLAGTNDGWWDWDLVENQLFYSPRWWAMLGYTENEIEIKPSLYPNYVHPNDRDRVDVSFKNALANGTTSYEIECKLLNKNGEYIPILSRGFILRDQDNKPIRVSGSDMDLTEQKKSEELIKLSEEKYRSLIETSPEIILIADREEKIQFINFAFPKRTKEEIIGRTLYDFLDPIYHDEISLAHRRVFKGSKSESYETQGSNHAGDKLWFLTHVGPKYLDGEVVGLVLFITNITDRKISEEKIKQSLNEKEVLLKEVHHRVKNNLQIISSILNLQSSTITDQQTIELLRNSQDRIRSMSLIHELLYQTKDFSTINFSEYIQSIATNLFQSYTQNKMIELKLDLDSIYLDLDLAIPCGLIINELITNSLKYGFENAQAGEIRISLKKEEDIVILQIGDSGKGLPSHIDFRETESLGMQLVVSLTDQIDGEINLNNNNGAHYELKFNSFLYPKRI